MINVLYVEDELSLSQIVAESLEVRGFNVITAQDGAIALDKFEENSIDICVLDIMLPKMDGYTLASKILKKKTNIPIIFLTAKTQTKDVIRGFESGGRDYIKKPFSMEELIVRINNLLQLNKNDNTPSDTFEVGKFTFLPNRYELTYEGKTIPLSERESRILNLLCIHMNRSCDRKDILMEIWGDDGYYNSRNLDVYVTKLRKILSVDPSIEIVTLKGVGYVFKV